MEPFILTSFEVGQLYAALGTKGLAMLSPELRTKIKDSFREQRRIDAVPLRNDAYEFATDETPINPVVELPHE